MGSQKWDSSSHLLKWTNCLPMGHTSPTFLPKHWWWSKKREQRLSLRYCQGKASPTWNKKVLKHEMVFCFQSKVTLPNTTGSVVCWQSGPHQLDKSLVYSKKRGTKGWKEGFKRWQEFLSLNAQAIICLEKEASSLYECYLMEPVGWRT